MADTRVIDYAKMEPVHDILESIRFRAFSLRAFSLKGMILDITAHQNIDDYDISMSSTNFNKLDINIIDFRPGRTNEASCAIFEEEEKVDVKISVNQQ
jgi:hypothetical protein